MNREKLFFAFENMEEPKFTLGERLSCGIVVDICNGLQYEILNGEKPTFNKIDPIWTTKAVYTVFMNEPTRALSLEDYLSYNPIMDEDDYYKYVKETHCIAFIEEQLLGLEQNKSNAHEEK